ncbi:hypothetical protein WM40_25550 [Robbsia andropogonis]|uniref:Transmembrane protein n=1 Tax=Robbsia andropogonis TaxID=28092 RepID=A0A0F5JUR8_9BURK|nr:hypothetical protein WM40_25550 [Robbsia andropogonis]
MDRERIEKIKEAHREWERARYLGGLAFHWVPKWKRWLIAAYILGSGLLLFVMLVGILNRLSGTEILLLAIGISSVPSFIWVSREERRFYQIRDQMRTERRN